jgi:hypothetical protein
LAVRQSRKVGPERVMSTGGTKADSDRTLRVPNTPAAPVLDILRAQKAAR